MTLMGLLGVILALLAWQVAFVEKTRTRIAVFFLAFLFHIGTAVVYYFWSQTTSADAIMYYYDPYRFYGTGFGMGTRFVVYLVQFLRESLGGTYLDYFLLFQAFGFWGIVFLMRTFEEVHIELGTPQSRFSYLLLLLPGVHFWTSAIGKDGPLFLAASLAVWSAMRLRRRFVGFSLAVLLMVLFRPISRWRCSWPWLWLRLSIHAQAQVRSSACWLWLWRPSCLFSAPSRIRSRWMSRAPSRWANSFSISPM